jgi:hypothetical protein
LLLHWRKEIFQRVMSEFATTKYRIMFWKSFLG